MEKQNNDIEFEKNNNNNEFSNNDNNSYYSHDYGEASDFRGSNTSINQPIIENADIVYEDMSNSSLQDKIKTLIYSVNKRNAIVVGSLIVMIFVIVIIILLQVSRTNASYKAKIIMPDIVYMGETSNISVTAKGKKNTNQTKTKFNIKNDRDKKVINVLNEELQGADVINTIIPIQEGKAQINIKSILGKRVLADESKKIIVCPAMNTDLLVNKDIFIQKDDVYDLQIDFGEKECGKDVSYSSSNDSIMKVENGQITGVNIGTAVLTIKTGDRSFTVPINITKNHVDLDSFEVNEKKLQLSSGEKVRLRITQKPINATSGVIAFRSNDDNIVAVSEGGVVTAKNPGKTTIRVITNEKEEDIEVVVTDEVTSTGSPVMEIVLNKTNIELIQGNSIKVTATVTPDDAKSKNLKWKSEDENIAAVSQKGVIYGKNEGTTTITVTADNNVSRTIKVTVLKIKTPSIKVSDDISSNNWHNKPFAILFEGSGNGTIYYYGTDANSINNMGSRVTISSDGISTYYVAACKNVCTNKCDKDKKDKNCKEECKKSMCSDSVSYISKLDMGKPEIKAVAGIAQSQVKKETIQIPMEDSVSGINKWCIIKEDDSSKCKWNTIASSKNPVIKYTIKSNGVYYIFAKDQAGNISNSYELRIFNIE